jgi:hypothetical protein
MRIHLGWILIALVVVYFALAQLIAGDDVERRHNTQAAFVILAASLHAEELYAQRPHTSLEQCYRQVLDRYPDYRRLDELRRALSQHPD